jgi:glycosyltransferase involved in cell wall biosynthesis
VGPGQSELRILFVNRFFHPDLSATSQMLTDLAEGLSDDHDITVVTSRSLYNDPLVELPGNGRHKRVRIVRLNSLRLGRERLWGRILDYSGFYVRVVFFLIRHVRKNDVVVLKTDPPLLSLVNSGIVWIKGGFVINWLQDLFPEVAVELGAFPRTHFIRGPLTAWRNRSLRSAGGVVAISEKMKSLLSDNGISNITVIPNWADGELISPLENDENPKRAEWNEAGRFLVGSSGNFGRAHTFDEVLDAIVLLEVRPEIHFVLIGEGAGLREISSAVERLKLENVSLYPYQPYDKLRQSLGAIDLHLVTLKKNMEGLVFPSKIFGVLAAGRPLAFVGDADGEIAELIDRNGIGVTVERGDGAGLAQQITRMSRKPEQLRQMGTRARELFERDYARPIAIRRWKRMLGDIAPAS